MHNTFRNQDWESLLQSLFSIPWAPRHSTWQISVSTFFTLGIRKTHKTSAGSSPFWFRSCEGQRMYSFQHWYPLTKFAKRGILTDSLHKCNLIWLRSKRVAMFWNNKHQGWLIWVFFFKGWLTFRHVQIQLLTYGDWSIFSTNSWSSLQVNKVRNS